MNDFHQRNTIAPFDSTNQLSININFADRQNSSTLTTKLIRIIHFALIYPFSQKVNHIEKL